MGSARVSGVAIVLLGYVQWQLKVTKSFKALQTTHTYNPAGRAYGWARWRDGGLWQASVLWGTNRRRNEKEEGRMHTVRKTILFIWTFFVSNSRSPWVSSLPSLPACIMGATPHILKKSERERTDCERRVFPHAVHSSTYVGMCSTVCVWVHQCIGIKFHLSSTFPLPLWTSCYSGSTERRSDGSVSRQPVRTEERRCDWT